MSPLMWILQVKASLAADADFLPTDITVKGARITSRHV